MFFDGQGSGRGFRGRVRPGKASSLVGLIVGIGFIFVGLLMLGQMARFDEGPASGVGLVGFAFMVVWLLAAVGITVFHGYNLFGQKGLSVIDVDVEPSSPRSGAGPAAAGDGGLGAGGSGRESSPAGGGSALDFDVRLRKLAKLREDGLITREEYERKRAEILAEKW